jgi:predicted CXXCH cytochrome family protein
LGAGCSRQTNGNTSVAVRTPSRAAAQYLPPATFYGDGATNDGTGGWTISSAQSGQCLSCHNGTAASDVTPYLKTGHKNILRKITPNKVWAAADGTLQSVYFLTDSPPPTGNSLYSSGSTFDWPSALITIGGGPATVGTSPFPPGTQRTIFYEFGGWSDPTALDTVFQGGFTGEQWPAGNYDCARCHTTGYRFDDTGVEPTYSGSKIAAADFSRVPTDYDPANPSSPNASWMLDGIQCERCHNATGHTASGNPSLVSKPTDEDATALCLQCHREENVDTVAHAFNFGACSDGVTADYATCVGIPGNTWMTDLIVYDGGSCADGVSPDYGTCIAAASTWNFAPFFDHESGPTFLNGPHARFSGALAVANQNQTDMSLIVTGTYTSKFQDTATGANAGCTGCHDPHQSLVPAVGAAKPLVKGCTDCHTNYTDVLLTTNHPNGANSPFDTGGDLNGACAVCHMSQAYHLFRISTDPSYSTFPSAAQIYQAGGQSSPNTAPDGLIPNAVWADVDLACGQCHGGSGLFPTAATAPSFSKASLAGNARCIHGKPVVHTSAGPNGSLSPAGTAFVASGANQTFTFSPVAGYEVQSITVDQMLLVGPTSSYTFSNVTACHSLSVAFAPMPTITATANAGGSISPVGVNQAGTGTNMTFTITPNPGYQIQTVILDGATSLGAIGSYTFANIHGSHTLTANFIPIKYTITATAGANGSINPGTASFVQGSNQKYTFTPNAGYSISAVTVDSAPQGAITSYTFTDIQANHAIAVTFAANPPATITASANPNGTMTPAPGTYNLLAGQSQSFAFTPNAGYRVSSVVVDGTSVGAPTSYTFYNVSAGNHSLVVSFTPNTYTVTVTAYGNGNGVVTNSVDASVISAYGTGTETIPSGGSITYTFKPNTGYAVSSVTVDATTLVGIGSFTFSNVRTSHTMRVNFTKTP